MNFRSSLFTILILLAATFVVAQEDYVVFEGDLSYYNVNFHPGNNYQWEVVKHFNPTVYATSNDYDFITRDDTNEVEIRWKNSGRYYVLLSESDESGCSNTKALAVLVLANNRSTGFEILNSNSCFDGNGNSFSISVKTLNRNGLPLESEYFPINVEFTVNGILHVQQLNFNNQVLNISEEWFYASLESNSEITVEITNVTDNDDVPIQVRSEDKMFGHTIYSVLEIAFSGNQTDTIYLNTSNSFQAEYVPGYNYEWWFTDSIGMRYDFDSNAFATENYFWNRQGTFELFVQATNETGCKSEVISKTIVVTDEIRIPQLVALPDFSTGYVNTIITGNVADNDFLSPARSWNLVYSLIGEPISGLTFNSDGSFVFFPDENFTGEIGFTYQVCFEDPSVGCATSECVILVIPDNSEENIPPIAVTDVVLTFPDQMVVGNLLTNDFDPDGNRELLSVTLIPVLNALHGTVTIAEDGSFSYLPDTGFEGSDKFVYRICDSGIPTKCDTGSVYIVVNNFDSGSSKPISTSDDIFITNEDPLVFAGNDTTIGRCEPYVLNGIQFEGDGYSYLWEPSENLNDPAIPNPVFTPGSSAKFYLTITNSNGFSGKDSVMITVTDAVAEAGDDIFMVESSTAVLDGSYSSGLGLKFNWTTNDGSIESGADSPNPVINEIGTYYLQVTDTFGCLSIDSVNVGILTYAPVAQDDYDTTAYQTEVKIPVLDNDFDPENDIDSLTLSISSVPFNGTAYVSYNDYTIHYRPNNNFNGTDYFEYQICDLRDNCDEAKVTVWVSDMNFFIPDAFSPNGDNINDYFEIPGIEYYEGNSIEIFNRWGNKIYESKNYGISTIPKFWDGKSNTGVRLGNEELPTGTYFYIINLGNGEKRIAGSVYLDR